mgnify:FL=1
MRIRMTKHTQRITSSFDARWSAEVGKVGFLMKPACLVRCFADFGLTTTEALVLDLLFSYWYDYEKPPEAFPSSNTIARSLGIAYSTVGTHIRSLEAKGYIARIARTGTSNKYDLQPTIDEVRYHVSRRHLPENEEPHPYKLVDHPP